jgi:predicted transcriptional regulator of viral defense system
MDTIIQNLPTYMDYNWLTSQLADYASPRVKINALLKKGEIIRIKKGIYIPGPKYKRDISRGVLSNLIYGPSYVSFEYALSWYGLIPERVYSMTCACFKKKKTFNTPLGLFAYNTIPGRAYSVGVELVNEANTQFLMASAEKAMADTLAKSTNIESMGKLEEYLYHEHRMEYDEIQKLNKEQMTAIGNVYKKKNITLFADYLNLKAHNE